MYSNYQFSHTFVLDQEQNNIQKQHNKKKKKDKDKKKEEQIKQQQSQNIIKLESEKDEEDEFDDLFRIGEKDIISKDRKQKKEKKIKKQKKQKNKHKHKHKDKNKKKDKQKNRQQSPISLSDSQTPILQPQPQQSPISQQDPLQKLQKSLQLLSKYQKSLTQYKNLDNNLSLDKQFGLKQKIHENALPLDIIKFGLPELEAYGIQDREIPHYQRPPQFNTIIGFKSKKKNKIKKLLRQLNITTNQIGVNWNKYENNSKERYYHYSGYEKLVGEMPQKYTLKPIDKKQEQLQQQNANHQAYLQNGSIFHTTPHSNLQVAISIPYPQSQPQISPSIPYNLPESQLPLLTKLPTPEQKLRLLTKEYNTALNANPRNVELWLKFLGVQDRANELTVSGSEVGQGQEERLKMAVVERKLAIVGKAIEKNGLDWRLGLQWLYLLEEAKKDRREIEQNIKKLLQANPENPTLWSHYLHYKLSSLIDYNHSRLQSQYKEITSYLFEKRLKQVQSGTQVWKIRRCGLLLLKKILKVHRMEGYQELCTGICCGLMEFNVFCGEQMLGMEREERIGVFRGYWEDYGGYKLGECFGSANFQTGSISHCWQNYQKNKTDPHLQSQSPSPTFIGNLFTNLTKKHQSWVPTHTNHNTLEISLHPQTFILFQDIEPYLQTYRNIENWKFLCNIVMENLNMPNIFYWESENNENEGYLPRFLAQWCGYTYEKYYKTTSGRNITSLYDQHCFLPFVNKYWHPELSPQFLQLDPNNLNPSYTQLTKFIYTVNLVQCLYLKSTTISELSFMGQISQYLMFLYGTIYHLISTKPIGISAQVSQFLQNLYPKSTLLTKIQHLLSQNLYNIHLWALYIEYEYYVGKSVEECFSCYLAYLGTVNSIKNKTTEKNTERETQSDVENKRETESGMTEEEKMAMILWVIYYASQGLYRWETVGKGRGLVVGLIREILLKGQNGIMRSQQSQQSKPITLQQLTQNSSHLSPIQKLLLGNRLKSLLTPSTPPSTKLLIYYTLLEIGQSPSSLIPHLTPFLNLPLCYSIMSNSNMLQLINLRNLVIKNIRNGKISVKLLGDYCRWAAGCGAGVLEELGALARMDADGEFSLEGSKGRVQGELMTWLLILKFMDCLYKIPITTPSSISHQTFHKNILLFILKPLKTKLLHNPNHDPTTTIILNKILQNPQLAYNCLSIYPYCRELYIIVRKNGGDIGNKIGKLMEEKEIRDFY